MKKKNYGYKICYNNLKENTHYCHFMTYTNNHAKKVIKLYKKHPPTSRINNQFIVKAKWIIVPISKAEVLAGIWREDPF